MVTSFLPPTVINGACGGACGRKEGEAALFAFLLSCSRAECTPYSVKICTSLVPPAPVTIKFLRGGQSSTGQLRDSTHHHVCMYTPDLPVQLLTLLTASTIPAPRLVNRLAAYLAALSQRHRPRKWCTSNACGSRRTQLAPIPKPPGALSSSKSNSSQHPLPNFQGS